MSAVSRRRLSYSLLTVVVGMFGVHSAVSALDGLPPIHESSASGVAAAAPPPAPTFSARKLPLEQRLVRLERMADNQSLLEMLSRLEDLQVDLQAIRGELEMQRHEFDGIKQRQRDLYLDIDRRILKLEKVVNSAPVAAFSSLGNGFSPSAMAPASPAATFTAAPQQAPLIGSVTPPLGDGASVAVVMDPLQEQSAYQQALNILREGRYDEAIVAFQGFLTRFQGSQYAGNAQYWIGEANYVSRDFRVAVEEFQKVVSRYPESSKVSDAMLKTGYTFYELQAWEQAQQTLSKLVERFPKTTAAQLAENRLHRMKLEGH